MEEHVVAFIGATELKANRVGYTWDSVSKLFKERPKSLTYTVDMMFIHPLFGTSKAHDMNPDLALARLSRPVPAFSDNVRPICLSRSALDERPICPDSSTDRRIVKTDWDEGLRATEGGNKILGGCATIAGWGLKSVKSFLFI